MVKKFSFLKPSTPVYKIAFIFSCFFLFFSCVSEQLEKQIENQTSPPIIKQYEYEFFSKLQKQTIENMSKRTFLSYRNDFVDINGRSLLILAILSRQLHLLPVLFENGVDTNIQDFEGNTALMYAVLYPDNVSTVKLLLKEGADPNLQNDEGKTALMFAVEYNIIPEYIDLLIFDQIDLQITDHQNQTVWDYLQENPYLPAYGLGKYFAILPEQQLIEAVKNPRLKHAETLIRSSKDPLAIYHNNTDLLMWAAKYNSNPAPIIQSLSKKIPIDATDINGNSVAHYVMNNTHSNRAIRKAVNMLIRLGAPMNLENINGETPFLLAIKNNLSFDIIENLVRNTGALGVPVNIQKALIFATEYNNNTAVHQLLIDYGANIHTEDSDGRNLIYYFSKGINKNDEFLFTLYLDAGVDIRKVGNDGNIMFAEIIKSTSNVAIIEKLFSEYTLAETISLFLYENRQRQNLLHIAGRYTSSIEIINLLMAQISTAFLRQQDGFGKVPLIYAIEYNPNSNIIKEFVALDDPLLIYRNPQNDMNLIMYAAKNTENPSILRDILNFYIGSRKNIVNQKDINGNTALHYAVQNEEFINNVRRLLNVGADVNAQNNLGQTPLMLAVLNDKTPDITPMLIRNRKIDLEISDNNNRTAFAYAAEDGVFFENIQLLYGARADSNYITHDGKSILDLIKENRNLFIYLDPFE